MRHRRIGSTDLVASEVGLAVWPLVAGPGGAVRRGRRRPARGRPRPRDRLLRGHRQRRRRPGRGAARPGRARPPGRGHGGHHLRLRHHPAALGAGPGRAPARLVGRVRRPGPGPLAAAAAAGAGRPVAPAPSRAWTPSSRTSCSSSWTPRWPRARSALRRRPRPRARLGRRGRGRPPGAAGRGRRDRLQRGRAGPGPRSWPPWPPRPAPAWSSATRWPRAWRPPTRARLGFLERDRDQTLDQALLRFALADPAVATVLPEVRDRDHLAELAGAADLRPPTAEDLDRIAELREEG